ncbi:hypothetical protein ANANG_G00130760 [Anguilla anguilla]|uniref:Ubiquitin-like domain-containing protein n=1 Tax=Anguilla anguilla TaxID=7936 RepID=A0A9D3MH88_ANGAN|nr:hypothetical protein ANANG_G00130760 [Anguilla anguilla]
MDQHPRARSCTDRGAASCEVVPGAPSMNLHIHSTTGTRFELSLPSEETVEGLKRRLSQRLRVPKERLALLHKETPLNSGKLQDFGIADGSKLTLVPTVEAGLMSQQTSRPEQSIMQALESLTETQVSDFLSGRSPLTLALRVGDHMMFVQLQLAAQQSGGQQLHHRHLIARGGPAPLPPRGFGSGGGRVRVLSTPIGTPPTSPCAEATCRTQTPGAGSAPSSSRSRKPGAVIESFVSHAPGVFSGTFSGTLHPSCQDGTGRPRRDVGTILQILNDLLSATRHYQGVPASLAHLRCQTRVRAPSPPPSPRRPLPRRDAGPLRHIYLRDPRQPLAQCQDPAHGSKPAGDGVRQTENTATRCKVQRLQLLMERRRLRRKARRDGHAPYPWLANRRAGRGAAAATAACRASRPPWTWTTRTRSGSPTSRPTSTPSSASWRSEVARSTPGPPPARY